MASFIEYIISALLELIILALVVNAIISWLIAFDVINTRNRVIYQLIGFLDAVTRPILRPVQRVIPPFGGVDISPIIVIIVLVGVQRFILPLIFAPLRGVLG
jgi:YggT family protein